MAALDVIASELLKSAREADLNYKKTRDLAERDKAIRLRKIVENLKLLTANPTLDQVLTAGNTSTNTLNVGGITTDYVQLDTTATPTLQPGMFAWNDQDGTADLRLKGGNVTLQVGQETLARVVNKTGADLLESQYKVVRVRIASEGGSQGQRLAVVLAQGNNDPDSVTTLGIVTETILNNQEGFITIFGNVNGINTTGSLQGETWVDGDVLFLSPTTPGALTKVKPIAPNHTVVIGYVIYAHGVNGKIFVKVDNGYELDELHNVKITSVANNDLIQYDSVQQVWKNVAASVAVPTPTLAQVTTAGNTTANSIVIGSSSAITASPYTLQVVGSAGGSAIFSNSAKTQGLNINLATAGETRIYSDYFGAGVDQKLILGTFANRATQLVLQTSGNVSIGTTTDAGYKLDVNGTARINSSLYVTDSAFTGSGRFYQAANATTIISGGPAGENITFGPSNRIFLNAGQTRFPSGSVQMVGTLSLGSLNAIGNQMLWVAGSITASSAVAKAIGIDTTLVAAANNDVLVGLDINPTFANGAFTGVQNLGVRLTSAPGNNVLFRTGVNNSGTHSILFSNAGATTNSFIRAVSSGTFSNMNLVLGQAFFDGSTVNTTNNIVIQSNSSTVFEPRTAISYAYLTGDAYVVTAVNNTNAVLGFSNGSNATSTRGAAIFAIAGGSFSSTARLDFAISNVNAPVVTTADVAMSLFNSKNFAIGSTTDAGYKLDVAGTFRYTGGGFFQGGTNTPVSIGAYMMTYVSSTTSFIHAYNNTSYAPLVFRASTLSFYSGQGSYGQWGLGNTGMNLYDAVSGVINHQWARDGVARSSGTTPYVAYTISPVINNTGTYSGIVRGIYYNPTLTSVTGTTHRAIETTSGDVVFNGGNVGIGTPTPTELLHIVNNTNGNKFARISAGAADASAAWVAQNDQVDNIVYRVFGSGVAGFQMGIALARSASLIANLDGTGKFLIGTYSNTDIIFGTGDQSRIRVSGSNGNVMIGTLTDIGAKLNVSGDVNALGYRVNNVVGYTGILNIPGNPPGQQNVDIQGGIIVNIF